MNKVGNFLEEHIEKMVLVVIGLVCLWLLVTRVVISPNHVTYEKTKFSPNNIDDYISGKVRLLEEKLNSEAEPKPAYKARTGVYLALMDSAIKDIDIDADLLQAGIFEAVGIRPLYGVPLISHVSDVSAEHIRAVAYVPTEEIDEENPYDEKTSEPNNIDFVTVEAKFDVEELYESFYENFAGDGVPEDWRDPCLGIPVFAAVQLQRKQLLDDGNWSEWQVVPRTKIDHRKELFQVIEDVGELPAGGIKARLLRFAEAEVKVDLLQPEPYNLASANEEWFPPSLHKEYKVFQVKMEREQRLEAIEAKRQERERTLKDAREKTRTQDSRRTSAAGGVGSTTGSGGGGSTSFNPFGKAPKKKPSPVRRARYDQKSESVRPTKIADPSQKMADFCGRLEEMLIDEDSGFRNMSEPLTLWAHDDTVEPENTYRYRIRVGVFNPVAGTDQISEQYQSQKNHAILWSAFSEVPENVQIPGTLYFFPQELLQAAKTVTVEVSKYELGYWYSKSFKIQPGEVIGSVVETEAEDDEEEEAVTPRIIDYSTGVVLVDVVPVKKWSGGRNMRQKHYSDMLYSCDGTNIEHVPIRASYWPQQLQLKYNNIKRAQKNPREEFRDWGSGCGSRRWRVRRRSVGELEDYRRKEDPDTLSISPF